MALMHLGGVRGTGGRVGGVRGTAGRVGGVGGQVGGWEESGDR